MKTLLCSVWMISICYFAMSQSAIDKYCQIEAYHKNNFTSAYTFRFVPGVVDSLFSFKDSGVVMGLEKVNGLKTFSDTFNLLTSQGWQFVGSTTIVNGALIEFFFKKEFDRRELN